MSSIQHLEFVKESLKPYISESESLHSESHLTNDLFLDSVALLSLCTEIENHYKIFLPDDFENPPETISDVISLIEQGLKERLPQ